MARIVGWKCRDCDAAVIFGAAHKCPGRDPALFDAACAECKMPWPCSCAHPGQYPWFNQESRQVQMRCGRCTNLVPCPCAGVTAPAPLSLGDAFPGRVIRGVRGDGVMARIVEIEQPTGETMPSVTIPVGSYSIWTLNVTASNGQPDTTSTVTASAAQGGFVQIDPVSSSPNNRQFYVTGVAATNSLTLVATCNGRQVFEQVAVSQPDLSGITSAGFSPVQQGPHP